MTETKAVASSPLANKWTLRYDSSTSSTNQGQTEWEDRLVIIANLCSVQEFWGTLLNIKPPSQLDNGANYHFFLEGIMPAWYVL